MDIHRLRLLVKEDFEAVNDLIVNKIRSDITLIDDLSHHIIDSGGKRLRPLIVLLASRACQYEGDKHISLAAMVEFFHTATLLHDDVIDESKLRRGRETANEIWGSKASILVGDYLYTQFMDLMINVGDLNIMRLLTDITHEVTCGELQQLSNRNKLTLTEEDYLEVIRAKTALLFATSATLGAMISKADKAFEQGLYQYGIHLGNAFQLIDDALDYCSDAKTLGKNIGDDLADGKATMPLLHALKHGNQTQREKIEQSLVQGTLEFLPDILKAIEDTNAIEYTQTMAKKETQKATLALQSLPDSVYKNALIDLATYAIERKH